MLKVVELFAGVGGFRLALSDRLKGFDFVWANQWEPGKKIQHAFNCYTAHFGTSNNHINEDIALVKGLIPYHNLLVGGFPCQDYSVARSNAQGIQGKKGILWWEIYDIIKQHSPRYILLENVDRLLKSPSSQRGRDFAIILRCLFEMGYYVEWRVINAADYGFAQRRRRVFIFAILQSSSWAASLRSEHPQQVITNKGFFGSKFPTAAVRNSMLLNINRTFFDDLSSISDNYTGRFSNSGYMSEGAIFSADVIPQQVEPIKLREILENCEVAEDFYISDDLEEWKYLKGAKREARVKPNGEPYIYSEGSIPFPDSLDKPARTILTNEGARNRSTHIIEDPRTRRLRLLTPKECERLNGFPDDWTNTGMPLSWRYFVMGNALVVPVAKILGERLIEIDTNYNLTSLDK